MVLDLLLPLALVVGFLFLAGSILFVLFYRKILRKKVELVPSDPLFSDRRMGFLDNTQDEEIKFGQFEKGQGVYLKQDWSEDLPTFYAQQPFDFVYLGFDEKIKHHFYLSRLNKQGYPLESESDWFKRLQAMGLQFGWMSREEKWLKEREKTVNASEEQLLYETRQLRDSKKLDWQHASFELEPKQKKAEKKGENGEKKE
jgi:hypothetical protein